MQRYTREEAERLIELSARHANILAIGSGCDANCVFCSHKNNPPDIKIMTTGMRSMEDIKKTIPLLSREGEICIGESATRIIEGEPMLHPRFLDIIRLARERFPHTPISITTNGHHLTPESVKELSRLAPILINLSLNSSSPQARQALMGDSCQASRRVLEGVLLLTEHGLPFHASIVAMPNITGFQDMRESIEFAANNGALSVRVFIPGFSQYADTSLFPDPDQITAELMDFMDNLPVDLPCPVLLEPSQARNLRAVLSGAIKDSPAWRAGLRKGDEILSVNGARPRSRVEAYTMLGPPGEYRLSVIMSGRREDIILDNPASGMAGVTMEYDFDMGRAEYLRSTIASAPGHVLALTSEFACSVFREVLREMNISDTMVSVRPVKNLTFGGTIRAAGLLCCSDYKAAFEEYCEKHGRPGAVLLPGESFDYLEEDLKGHTFTELRHGFNLPTALV